MKDFYQQFYTILAQTTAHAEFCARVFGRDLCQHGFADMAQLEKILEVTRIGPGQRALDLGCGNGLIAEYLSDCSGAHFTGLDYIPTAIEQARQRTAAKADRLAFQVGDINALDLPDHTFDLIVSIDTLYFSDDYALTLRQLRQALKPGGQMAIYFAHGRMPWEAKEDFPTETVQPDQNPLGEALKAAGMPFQTWDFTQDDYRLAQLRKEILAELRPRFEAEGLTFIYENRSGDANGVSGAVESGQHGRYLYLVRP